MYNESSAVSVTASDAVIDPVTFEVLRSVFEYASDRMSTVLQRASFSPSNPVGLVLKSLAETRQAVESRAEPSDVVRERITGVGRALLHEADRKSVV